MKPITLTYGGIDLPFTEEYVSRKIMVDAPIAIKHIVRCNYCKYEITEEVCGTPAQHVDMHEVIFHYKHCPRRPGDD